MTANPEFVRLALLAGLVSASFAAIYLLRRHALSGSGGVEGRSSRAIRSARREVSRLDSGRDPRRQARARMQLAMLLTESGGRHFDPAALHEAIELLKSIVPVFEAQGLTPEWASAVYYRGRAEWGLGMLQSGTGGLERAVSTFRHLLAMENWPRHLLRPVVVSLPAVILIDIGQRRMDPARMEEGLELAREAAEAARRRIPVEWAITHRNLAHCLAMLGCERPDITLLEEAVGHAREAVAAVRRSRFPSVWTASQATLAHALAELGDMTSDTSLLREALDTYALAADESDEEALHEGRVNLSQGIGHALLALGRQTGDAAVLAGGILRLEQAMADFRRSGLRYAQGETARLLGLAHASLAELRQDDGEHRKAAQWYEEAGSIFADEGAFGHAEEVASAATNRPAEGPVASRFVPGYQVK